MLATDQVLLSLMIFCQENGWHFNVDGKKTPDVVLVRFPNRRFSGIPDLMETTLGIS